MKKFSVVFSALALSALFFTGFTSCKKENPEVTLKEAEQNPAQEEIPVNTDERTFDTENFFTPDYTPYTPEEEAVPQKLRLSAPESKGKGRGIIPPLRKLSEYKSSYNTEKSGIKIPSVTNPSGADEKNADDSLFSVADWGPKGSLPAEVRYPSFYVLFSEPVVTLSAIGQQAEAGDFLKIEPEIKGSFRWNSTSLLSFDCTEAADPMQTYTITVSDSVKSLSGKSLTGERKFTTEASPLEILWSAPGYSKNKWIDQNEVPPEYSKEFRVQFNYPVKAEEIKKIAHISAGFKAIEYTVKQELEDTLTFEWKENIPFDTTVTLIVEQLLEGKYHQTKAKFHTLSPFAYEYKDSLFTYGKYTNPILLVFSHPVDEQSVAGALTVKNDKGEKMPFTKENYELSGTSIKVYGLPVTFHSKYTIEITRKLKDSYKRPLEFQGDEPIKIEVEVPGAESMVRFTDSGVKMLESEFPHKMVFEHQNIISGAYSVKESSQPYSLQKKSDIKKAVYSEENNLYRTELKTEPKDERIFEQVDFDKHLKNGKGWVEFLASITLPRKPSKWDPSTEYSTSNKTSVQVTNLAATVRYGMNRIVVLVSQLSDGKAVEGAKVYAYKDKTAEIGEITKNGLTAVTDKDGMAVIEIPKDKIGRAYDFHSYWTRTTILVIKDDDRILFEPEDHYPWRSGIYSYSQVPKKLEAVPRIFMFSDRGLYKPGETVSFRGIDRDQLLGSFIPYTGDFTVTLMEDTWRNAKKYGNIEGVTSESGGFYGSFTIPEDIEPGIYKIVYKRGKDGRSQEMRINVAFFERLKFQTEIAMPKTPVIAGEKIQAKLGASYLAGGALSSARYETNWFREPWYFTSDEPEFKQYTFGPLNSQEGRSHIREDSGSLDAGGKAVISCETSGSSIKGAPYRYRASSDVTDLSNQQISASGATVVHPASFYLGLSKPEKKGAFAKKGEKLTFTYKMADPEGKAVKNDSTALLLAGKGKNLKISLTREEWTLVQQQGIRDIYSRYEKTDVLESEESTLLSADGKITVTPKEVGYHKIHIATSDKKGRDVITEYGFFVTGSGKASWYQDDASELKLTPDKNMYNPGETAHILLESSLPEGNYLITVEREGIFTEEVRHLSGNIHVLDIPVARNYLPVFYVSISSYSVRQGKPGHQYGEEDLDKPKGFYGAAQLFVNPRIKSFTVNVESSKPSYRPGEEAQVTLTATKGGKPLANAELTLMAVDRGVLDLVNYHVPDPIKFFYNTSNFPLKVSGGDSRSYLMDPVTYEVKNLKGGDTGEDEKINERSDFNPTAVFEPMLKTDENGRVTAKFKLPDTLTTYRITVFGVNGELLALQEDEIAVQNPINVQQVLPRQLRERDTAELGVLLTNLDEKAHDITVSLAMRENDRAKAEENGVILNAGKAFVDGETEHTVRIESGENSTVYFELAAEKAGLVTLEFTIKSDILNEKLVTPLKIEKPYIFETVTTTGQINEEGDSATEKIAIPSYAKDMNGSLSVTLDATRLGLLGESVKYLFDYPYGCLEQQSARVLPLVIFADYIDVFNLDSEITDIKKLVRYYFKNWKNSQHGDGGFGYWPDSIRSNLFVSTRIAHIYALAKERGYTSEELSINIEMLLHYIKNEIMPLTYAKNHQDYDSYYKAYIYYVLAKNKKTVEDDWILKIINDDKAKIENLALAGLCAAEKDGPSSAVAGKAAEKIRTFMRPTSQGIEIASPEASKRHYACFGDKSENLALVLQLFTILDKDDPTVTRLVFSLMQNQRKGYWKNTATTARVLEAIYTLIKTNGLDKTDLKASALLNSLEVAGGDFKGAAAKPVTVTLPFNGEKIASLKKDTPLPLEISKNGKGSLYYTATMRYAIPEELQDAKDEGLGISMQLLDNATGEEIKAGGDSVVELESGKTYKVKITLSSIYDREFIALRAPVPSGAEILDATFVTSPDTADNASGDGKYSHEDGHYMSNQAIYNQEIQFFWDSFAKGKTTAEFKFRAVRRGIFPTPPACGECMYEPEVFGRTGGILYRIR